MSTLTIAAIQFDIQWQAADENFLRLENIIMDFTAKEDKIDLLLLPETFSSGFSIEKNDPQEPEDGGRALQWLKKIAKQTQATLAGSVLVTKGAKKANRFYWVSPSGEVDFYDKRHLFRMGNETQSVIPGNQRKIFDIKGIKVLPQVCYDLRFPVWSRNRNDYQLLIYLANWPAVRRNAWDILLQARAIENQAYVIGVNRIGLDGKGVEHSGGTAIYDFTGEVLTIAENNQQQIIKQTLDFKRLESFKVQFPAYLDADKFELKGE